MANYPIVVEMISRFRGKGQQTAILHQLRRGQIDIIIGTHRLLSSDIRFANLGLLVIDEEHRFGVRHKEKIKRLKENVDVLSMSATPIPRTLYLALAGARDLSVIETPPLDRLPIHTVVRRYDIDLIKDAITYEVNRGGQVFYLHNRVQSINSVALQLRQWLPDLRIMISHGQMDERVLEEVMARFVAGEFDVLVCTTIIESGLDIPNCNTIIIEGADRFGLSQLYQLRGRVGRFKRQAYAYLLLHRQTHPVEQAKRRLSAIRQYNHLGAGFKIAMRDLELRGSGNLLGSAQSGHIVGVGLDLYCQLLRQSIARLKGEKGADAIQASVHLDFVVLGIGKNPTPTEARDGYAVLKEAEIAQEKVETIEAYLPSHYIREAQLRITFYRQLAMAHDSKEIEKIGRTLKDRFGAYSRAVDALLLVSEIRCLAGQGGILKVLTEGERLKCLRASTRQDDYIRVGNRFPRLVRKDPILRLKEIRTFLRRQGSK
jgi:transcription-repair coupling factor (superfamily II helicase)